MASRFDAWLGRQSTLVWTLSAMVCAFTAAAVIIAGVFLIFGGK